MIYSMRAFGLYKVGVRFNQAVNYLFMALFPIANIALCGSIFNTVAISIERYLGIVYPLKTRSYRRNIWHYVVPITILAIGFNIPKILEIRVDIVESKVRTVNSYWVKLTYIYS